MAVSRRALTLAIATRLHEGEPKEQVLKELAAYIVTYHLQKEVPRILGDIRLRLAELGTMSATVTTARPLDTALRTQVEHYVASLSGAESVELIEVVDPAIKGGIVIETPDKRYDASISSKLKQLRNVT